MEIHRAHPSKPFLNTRSRQTHTICHGQWSMELKAVSPVPQFNSL